MADNTRNSGLSNEEREAVKDRARELRAQQKAGKSREAGEKSVAEAIAAMPEADRALAQGLHDIVSDVAPDLMPKTWYGMPAYANADGKVVVFFKAASKFTTRYATLGFEEAAAIDDGDMFATSFGLVNLTPSTNAKIRALIEDAVS